MSMPQKHERTTRVKLVETNAREKTACEALKCKSAVKIEEMRLQFQRDEAEKNRAHQLKMLKACIELAKLQGMGPSSAKFDSSLLDGMGPMLPMPGDYHINDLNLSGSSWDSSFSSATGSSLDA